MAGGAEGRGKRMPPALLPAAAGVRAQRVQGGCGRGAGGASG